MWKSFFWNVFYPSKKHHQIIFLPWLAGGIKYSLRGCVKALAGWKNKNIVWKGVKSISALTGWRNKIFFERVCRSFLLIGRKNLIFFGGVKSFSALAGWRKKIFLERVWKTLSWLAERIKYFLEVWKVFLPWLAEGRKYSLRGFKKLSPDWVIFLNCCYFRNRILLERVWKTLSWLADKFS